MKWIFILWLSSISFKSYSQDRKLPMFILMNEKSVTHWLDSLNSLSSNPYYKIKRGAADNGDLTLTCEYSLSEERLYKCLTVMVRFTYTDGENICTMQIIHGSEEYAEYNLKFVRDNFKNVSDGKWSMRYYKNYEPTSIFINAEFQKKNGDFPSFFLIYEVEIK